MQQSKPHRGGSYSYGCKLNASIVCDVPKNVSGVVYSPCEHDGNVTLITGLPVSWDSPPNICVVAGRAGGKLYVVLRGVAIATLLDPHSPFEDYVVASCYARKHNVSTVAIPAMAIVVPVYLVVDAGSGDGRLFFAYGWPLNNTSFLFADDGIYVAGGQWGVVGEILGPVSWNCTYIVKAQLDPSRLRVGAPLYNTSGVYVKIG
ncbi:MAG: hypothetical protein QXP98_09035 [Thermoproteus sp.]